MQAARTSPELRELERRLAVGGIHYTRHLALVPLLGDDAGPDAELLEEGISARHTELREVDDRGRVGEVTIDHRGTQMLLLIDGEQVLGAKQNRAFNASFLVAPGTSATIPVSCVERGRWGPISLTFAAAQYTSPPGMRTVMMCQVARSVSEGRRYDADQGRVWNEVDRHLASSRVASPTAALADAARVARSSIDDQLAAIDLPDDALGIAVIRGGTVLGIDVFGSRRLCARAWQKVARGALLDLDESPPLASPRQIRRAVAHEVARLGKLAVTRKPAPGAGETLHAAWSGGALGAVVAAEAAYHAHVALVEPR